jgi:hypothetical protein
MTQSDSDRIKDFFAFWSLKEAALKSRGEGLPYGPNAFEFELDPSLRVVHAPPDYGGPERFRVPDRGSVNPPPLGGGSGCLEKVFNII